MSGVVRLSLIEFAFLGVALDVLEFAQIIFVGLMVGRTFSRCNIERSSPSILMDPFAVLYFQTPQNEKNIGDRAGAYFFAISFVAMFQPAFKAVFECTLLL